jgi:hypothetical protein
MNNSKMKGPRRANAPALNADQPDEPTSGRITDVSNKRQSKGKQAAIKPWRELLKIHPEADKFPLLKDTDPNALREMSEDIQKNDLHHTVNIRILDDGTPELLDGRNRLDAIELFRPFTTEDLDFRRKEGGKKNIRWLPQRAGPARYLPIFNNLSGWDHTVGDEEALEFIRSKNLLRRHLTPEQLRERREAFIKAHDDWSSRRLAEAQHVDKNTIEADRKRLEGRGETSPRQTRTDTTGREQPASKPKQSWENFTANPELAERIRQNIERKKIEALERGNLAAEMSKVIAAGRRSRAKELHPDAGGTHEQMATLNRAVDVLKKGTTVVTYGEWWTLPLNDIAAQMATHFTIKQISELCAMAVDLRKTKQTKAAAQPSAAA